MTQNKPAPTSNSEEMPESRDYNQVGLERMIFFSDGVFTIAATLLTLEIRLPVTEGALTNEALLQNLIAIGPKYLGFILSFLVIGTIWVGHHQRYRYIERYDRRLLYLNLFLMMSVAFIPFPTAIISEYGNQTATIFYALSIIATGLLSAVIWWYASYNHRLINPSWTSNQIRREAVRILVVPAVFLLSIVIAFVDADLGKLSWLLLIPAQVLVH